MGATVFPLSATSTPGLFSFRVFARSSCTSQERRDHSFSVIVFMNIAENISDLYLLRHLLFLFYPFTWSHSFNYCLFVLTFHKCLSRSPISPISCKLTSCLAFNGALDLVPSLLCSLSLTFLCAQKVLTRLLTTPTPT